MDEEKYNSLATADVTVDVSFINTFHLQPSYPQIWSNFDDPAETAETIGWMLSDESGQTRRQWSQNVAVETSTILLGNRDVTGSNLGQKISYLVTIYLSFLSSSKQMPG